MIGRLKFISKVDTMDITKGKKYTGEMISDKIVKIYKDDWGCSYYCTLGNEVELL